MLRPAAPDTVFLVNQFAYQRAGNGRVIVNDEDGSYVRPFLHSGRAHRACVNVFAGGAPLESGEHRRRCAGLPGEHWTLADDNRAHRGSRDGSARRDANAYVTWTVSGRALMAMCPFFL